MIDSRHFLNVHKLFDQQELYKSFALAIESLLDRLLSLFKLLLSGMEVSGVQVFVQNDLTRTARTSCERVLLSELSSDAGSGLISYMYPILIFYYALIKYDLTKAEKFVYLYRNRLSRH